MIVLCPRPDDKWISYVGTLLCPLDSVASFHVVQMSEGAACLVVRDAEEKTRRKIRWPEAEAVDKCVGIIGYYWVESDMRHFHYGWSDRCIG